MPAKALADAGKHSANAAIAHVGSRPYPFWLGGVAACIAASITHPLDLTKVRLQASRGSREGGGRQGMFASMASTVRNSGVRGLWDGISGTVLRQMTYSLTRFATYERVKQMLDDGSGLKPWKLALAGSIAGGLAGLIGTPAEIVLVRMQADAVKAPHDRLNYKHCFDGLYKIVRDEGVGSLSRGLTPNVIRSVLMNASQLGSYDLFKSMLLSTGRFNDDILCHFVASFAAGTVATTVCSPADVLKSRIMTMSSKTTLPSLIVTSLRNEGPMVFFKGWLPAWTRLQPTTILTFVLLEELRKMVDIWRGDAKH